VPNNSFFRGILPHYAQPHHFVFSPQHELLQISFENSWRDLNNFSIMSSSESKSSMACRPWKLFHFALRVSLSAVLAWFVLALLWAFLPSPLRDDDPDNGSIYATSRLRAGKTLTRVYEQVPPVSFSCAAQANTGCSLAPITFASSTTIDKASQSATSWT
jgi:hypothetical protein